MMPGENFSIPDFLIPKDPDPAVQEARKQELITAIEQCKALMHPQPAAAEPDKPFYYAIIQPTMGANGAIIGITSEPFEVEDAEDYRFVPITNAHANSYEDWCDDESGDLYKMILSAQRLRIKVKRSLLYEADYYLP